MNTIIDYYPFGMLQPGRQYSSTGTYRYGYGNHEKLDEVSGAGNIVDLGGRLLDTRIGRTLSLDPEKILYSGISPFVYAIDNPTNVIDPTGKLIIFINGQHLGFGGGRTYWEGVDQKIAKQIGDRHTIYRDGSSGGFFNTLSTSRHDNNLNPFARMRAGYEKGKDDAESIIAGLKRDPNDPNKIIESIKIVTHSLGTVYSRGYTRALEEYVTNYNTSHKYAPLKGFNIETQVDIAAFQGCFYPIKSNIKNKIYMSGPADGIANGMVAGMKSFLNLDPLSVTSDVPGSKPVLGITPNTGHGVSGYGKDNYIKQIPISKNNGEDNSPKPFERPLQDHTRVAPQRKIN